MHAPPPALTATASGGYIDDAAEALATSNVFVSGEVDDAASLAQQLETQVGDASIGVAVFSDNAALEATGPEIVAQLAEATGYDTIIVAVGDDLSAGSRALERGEAARIANEAEDASGSVDDALAVTIQEIVAASEPAPAPEAGVDGGVVVGFALAVAALVAGGIAIVAGVRSRRRRRAAEQAGLPTGVATQIAALRSLSPEYAAVGASGNAVAAQTGREIDALIENVTELFARIGRRGDEGQLSMAEVEYDDKLRKLTAALNRDYLLDILTHPHLWDDPGERTREVQTALEGVSSELVDNIKQVNARTGLHFQVSLDGLIGRRKELQDWDRAFGQASDGPPDFPNR